MEAASTANSSTVTKLNSRSGEYNGIQLSPDKTRVVFTADDITGYSQIFVAVVGNFDNPTQLTSNQTVDHFLATFSPDGNTILSSVFNRSADLWTISMLPAVAGGTETVITNPSTLQPTPSFTPDGRKIVFAGVGIDGGLFIMNLDGSGRTQLTNLNSNVNQEDFFPSVSPDGTKIAFERGVFNLANDSWTYNIYVVGIGGESAANAATQLTTDGYSWGSMYAGDSIAFLSPKNNLATTRGDDIYMMSPDGSNVVQLTNKGLESFLTWNGAE
jgi:Tol biopolymer transport system component